MTALTLPELPSGEPDKRMRALSIGILGLAVLIAGASIFTAPAEAGSCTGYAALEAPLLPQTV